jgi:hypothetical protein
VEDGEILGSDMSLYITYGGEGNEEKEGEVSNTNACKINDETGKCPTAATLVYIGKVVCKGKTVQLGVHSAS